MCVLGGNEAVDAARTSSSSGTAAADVIIADITINARDAFKPFGAGRPHPTAWSALSARVYMTFSF
jgi:hypothetical protein